MSTIPSKTTYKNIDTKSLLAYLQNYNPYQDRFLYNVNNDTDRIESFKALVHMIQMEKINGTDFRNYDYCKLNRLLQFIYGENVRPEISQVISLVHRKIIKDYLNIPHLGKLFSEFYFEYEWEMHSSLDVKESKINFYRDHYFHQVRNLYEVMCLFDCDGIRKNIVNYFRDSDCNTARYCAEVVEMAKVACLGNARMNKYYDNLKKGGGFNTLDEYFEEYAYNYIIKGALIVASLTHDIGYPVDKQLQKSLAFRRFMADFIPDANIFEFESIRGIIENSLLFEVVGADGIQKALKRSDGKYDHGVLSALVLLVFYYKHGIINQLNHLQRAIIEIAAIICFDHTASYSYGSSNDKRENYPCYAKTPLSIWFRIFDDIQEWDRVYFEIRKYASLKICPKCERPIVRYNLETDSDNNYIVNDLIRYGYKCACKSTGYKSPYELKYGQFKQQLAFDAKTLNYIIACKRIYYFIMQKHSMQELDIFIDYNPYCLLDLLRISNCNFHSHRYNEIKTLQKFIKEARIDNFNINVIAYIEIEPDLLKRKIIYDFFMALHFLWWAKTNNTLVDAVYKRVRNEILTDYKFDFNNISSYDDAEIQSILDLKSMNDLSNYSLFYHIAEYSDAKHPEYTASFHIQSNSNNSQLFSNNMLNLLKKILGASKSRIQSILAPYLSIYINNIAVPPNCLYQKEIYSINESDISVKTIEEVFARKIQNYVNAETYNAMPRCEKVDDIQVSDNSISLTVESSDATPSDKFYSDLYYFARMNDFTEMLKEVISQNMIH